MSYINLQTALRANTSNDNNRSYTLVSLKSLGTPSIAEAPKPKNLNQWINEMDRVIVFLIQNQIEVSANKVKKLMPVNGKQWKYYDLQDKFEWIAKVRWNHMLIVTHLLGGHYGSNAYQKGRYLSQDISLKPYIATFNAISTIVSWKCESDRPIRPNACTKGGWLTQDLTYQPYRWIPGSSSHHTFTNSEYISGSRGFSLKSAVKYLHSDPKAKGKRLSLADEAKGAMMLIARSILKEKVSGYALPIIHPLVGEHRASNLALSAVEIMISIVSRDGKIYHDSTAYRRITRYDKQETFMGSDKKANALFHRTKLGSPASGVSKYAMTILGEHYMKRIVDEYQELMHEIRPVVEGSAPKHFLSITEDQLSGLTNYRDKLIILKNLVGFNEDGTMRIYNKVDDNGVTRAYNIMTQLSSRARTTLGYTQYDGAAMLQSIVIDQLIAKFGIEKVENNAPQHLLMVQDRKAFRENLCEETGKDIGFIKQLLSKVDNGGKVKQQLLKKSPTLSAYYTETRPFVEEYFNATHQSLIDEAKKLTHTVDKKQAWLQEAIESGQYTAEGQKFFGLFFHTWTQTERHIREIMKSRATGYCHDVHDAIATKEKLNVELINQDIKDAGYQCIKAEEA